MKTVLIDFSPKKKFTNSGYFMRLAGLSITGQKTYLHYRGPRDDAAVFEALHEADNVVLAMPVYVDSVPSFVMTFLEHLEAQLKQTPARLNVYALVNCGFYEGIQCEYTLGVLQCWCSHAGQNWRGGVGLGAGEMLGVIRIMPYISVMIALVQFIVSSVMQLQAGGWSFTEALGAISLVGFFINIGIWVLFSLTMFIDLARLGAAVRKTAFIGPLYTTVVCPSFLFVWFASLFWVIRALWHGVSIKKMYRKDPSDPNA